MLRIENHGSLALIRPETGDADTFVDYCNELVHDPQFMGSALAVSPHELPIIVQSFAAEGWEFQEG